MVAWESPQAWWSCFWRRALVAVLLGFVVGTLVWQFLGL